MRTILVAPPRFRRGCESLPTYHAAACLWMMASNKRRASRACLRCEIRSETCCGKSH